jgi:TonB family protein
LAHHSIPEPERDLPEPASPSGTEQNRNADSQGSDAPRDFEFDLAQLAARFASNEGGHLPPDLSANLALEVVLNEIVEQACLATGATGAAIIVERDGEMVCRASSGINAPELGARLGSESGLTAECIKTRQLLRCDDTQDDPRANAEACRYLDVRSVMVLPLLIGSELAGVFEAFSSYPAAFGERDERTLEALSRRVLKNLAQAAEPLPAPTEPVPLAESVQNIPHEQIPADSSFVTDTLSGAVATESDSTVRLGMDDADVAPVLLTETLANAASADLASRGMRIATWILAAAVCTLAVLVVVVGAERFSAHKSTRALSRDNVHRLANNADKPSQSPSAARTETPATEAAKTALTDSSRQPDSASNSPAATSAQQTRKPAPQPGSLEVYQNGKEIFRLPPSAEQGENIADTNAEPTDTKVKSGRSGQSVVQPAAIYELSSAAAEGSLLFRVEPDYPPEALQKQIQGPVVLEVHASRDGVVRQVKLISGQPVLAAAAIAAVKQWKFKPRAIKGVPVEMQTRVTLNFRLPR